MGRLGGRRSRRCVPRLDDTKEQLEDRPAISLEFLGTLLCVQESEPDPELVSGSHRTIPMAEKHRTQEERIENGYQRILRGWV